jgi:hypothetical protein
MGTHNRGHIGAMPPKDITQEELEAFRAFVNRLPHGKDLELVVLKAHLLIEERLNALIAARLKNPASLLAEERFESYYRIRLAQSFFPPDFHPWLWKALLTLNKVRNRVAHSVAPKGFEGLIDEIISTVPGDFGKEGSSRQERFELTLWSLFYAVSELVE